MRVPGEIQLDEANLPADAQGDTQHRRAA
jgi:hypothetical protein